MLYTRRLRGHVRVCVKSLETRLEAHADVEDDENTVGDEQANTDGPTKTIKTCGAQHLK